MHINELTSDKVLDTAFNWLCRSRQELSHNSDVWDFRWNWKSEKERIVAEIHNESFRFQAQREYRYDAETVEFWSARDALVLKALSIVLTKRLKPHISSRCFHVKGNGGIKAAVRQTDAARLVNRFVCRSDVRGYYAHIDYELLITQLRRFVQDQFLLELVAQYLSRTVEFGQNYRDVRLGISLGCPLSPLMGALYLLPLDEAMQGLKVFYVRFMDDWVILTDSRWRLRRAIAVMNRILNQLNVEKHPDKTFIGPTNRSFDFLGYGFISGDRLGIAPETHRRLAERIDRLYEQGVSLVDIGRYVQLWRQWAVAAVQLSESAVPGMSVTCTSLALPCPCAPRRLAPSILQG